MGTKANLVVDQGASFIAVIAVNDANGNPLNLTGFTGAAQMKKHWTSLNATATFVCNVATPNSGAITLSMDANTTGNIWFGRYVYDVRIVDSTNTFTRILEGIVTVTPAVTNQVFANAVRIYAESNISPTILANGSPDNSNNYQQ